MADLKGLKGKLIEAGMPEAETKKFVGYVSGAIRDEVKQKEKGKATPVTSNSDDVLYSLAIKYHNMGLTIDGVNVVITGKNMAMVTFNGYKNKVLSVYPETEFDIQLVREGDTFSFAKESGSVIYTHELADPFSTTDAKIVGAYVVFKNKRGEFLETLNRSDYEKMKKASKQSYLWGDWESEFWLKSVIKRACKRHFFDVVAEIDKHDNDNFGLLVDKDPDEAKKNRKLAVELAVAALNTAETIDELKDTFMATGLMQEPAVIAAKDARKAELTKESEDVKA